MENTKPEYNLDELLNSLKENKSDRNRITDKVMELITLKANSHRLSNIKRSERKKLVSMLAFNEIYMKSNPKTTENLVENYLNLSVSIDACLLNKIENMFKSGEMIGMGIGHKENE